MVSGIVGLFVGTFVAVLTYFDFLYQFTSEGTLIGIVRDSSVVLFYTVVWLAPNRGLFARRPATIYFVRYWTVYRSCLVGTQVLYYHGVDVGYCLFHVVYFFGFSLVMYW